MRPANAHASIPLTGSLNRSPLKPIRSFGSGLTATTTMPRRMASNPARRHSEDDILVIEEDDIPSTSSRVPPAIRELESLYAPMKNLLQPLPNAERHFGHSMPRPHPLSWQQQQQQPRQDDQESEVCSVIADIPPPPAPVQSHAILEESLGKELPRTPMMRQQQRWGSTSRATPTPTPPPVVPNPQSPDVYANLHRSSLMSTGSSENSCSGGESGSSASSSIPCGGEAVNMVVKDSAAKATPQAGKDEILASWTNYATMAWSPVAPPAASSTRIASPDVTSASDDVSSAGDYVRMSKPSLFPNSASDKECHYMNVLYNAVQRQGGAGSVESAMSPYMAMNGARLRTREEDEASAIYALPAVVARRSQSSNRVRSNSASRLSEISNLMRRSKSSSNGLKQSESKSSRKAIVEFKELMREVEKKRHFRVGLNLFNSKPELGVEYLVQRGFLELSPAAVARFLRDNTGLSKDKVGEYVGDLRSPFSMRVLQCFMVEFDFSGQRVDKSLRALLSHVRVPGEAQKIERVMEEFARRYVECNPSFAARLASSDSVVALAFAAMLLNTDLHSPSMRDERRMSLDDFTQNLRGVDAGRDFDPKLLKSMYKSIRKQEFLGGVDHVLQTQLIQQSIQGSKRPNLAEPHRRLVCLCRLFEVVDLAGANSRGQHQRDVFLFNDVMVTTKQSSSSSSGRKSSSGSGNSNGGPVYAFRECFELRGLEVNLFQTPVHRFGIQISRKGAGPGAPPLITLNAGSEHDRYKFVTDLQESIFEMDLMDAVLRRDLAASAK